MGNREKRELWVERIDRFLASGQSKATWCQEQGLPIHQLRYWLARVGDEAKGYAAVHNRLLGLKLYRQ